MKYKELADITVKDVDNVFTVLADIIIKKKNSKKSGPYLVATIDDGKNTVTSTLFSDHKFFKSLSERSKLRALIEIKVKEVKTSTKTGNFVEILKLKEVVGKAGAVYEIDNVKKFINEKIKEIENKEVRIFVKNVLNDPSLRGKFSTAPYSPFYYYSFEGGLICYIYDMLRLYEAIKLSGAVDVGNHDVIVSTIITHRCGKAACVLLNPEGNFEESKEGLINEDDVMTYSIVSKYIDSISDSDIKENIRHAIFSSKLHRNWGAAVEAKSSEAKFIHYIEKIILNNNEFSMVKDAVGSGDKNRVIKGSHNEYYLIKPTIKE